MKYVILICLLINGTSSYANTAFLSKDVLNYDIQWGHLIIGQISAYLEKIDNNYIIEAKSESDGAVSLLYDYKSELFASSYKKDGEWNANSYIVNSNIRNQKYYSKVDWNAKNSKLDVEINPPLNLEKVYEVDYSTLENVIDPVTAILKVVEKINKNKMCNASYSIFDGRRRYDLAIKELEKKYLINDRPRSFKGDTVVCGLKFTPIGGHRIESKWKPELDKFTDIQIFFGIVDGKDYFPVRMHINRWFGTITLRLLRN